MNYQHQLQLLVDIIRNQQDENYGTHHEYQQMQLLARDLMENPNVSNEIKSMLGGVVNFAEIHDTEGKHGNFSPTDLQEYINEFQRFFPFNE